MEDLNSKSKKELIEMVEMRTKHSMHLYDQYPSIRERHGRQAAREALEKCIAWEKEVLVILDILEEKYRIRLKTNAKGETVEVEI